jgi:hypothetical protein
MAAANRAFLSRAVRYLVDPGLTPMLSRRPDQPAADPKRAYYSAGVARKP